jgi:hypothetical protein
MYVMPPPLLSMYLEKEKTWVIMKAKMDLQSLTLFNTDIKNMSLFVQRIIIKTVPIAFL